MFVFTFFEGGTFKMNTFKYLLLIICNKKIIILGGAGIKLNLKTSGENLLQTLGEYGFGFEN